MKLLYIITGLGLGGAEKVVSDLADQMVLRGHTVKIAYLTGEVLVRPKSKAVEIIPLKLNSAKDFFAASRRYRKLIKQYQPDVVHAHMVHANIFARLNRLFCPIPKLICTAHSSNEGGKIRMLAYRYTNFLSNINTNVSNAAVASFIKQRAFNKNNLITVYNGIDLSRFKPISSQSESNSKIIACLAVGRLTPAKDYPNLLKAISLVIQTYPNIHLNIAGDGELREEITSLIAQLNLKEHVSLLGRRNDIPELMSAADFFILPSTYEGFGLVVAEAMACKTFVIATDCGGVKEIMGGYGLLVPPKNSEILANKIIEAIEMPKEMRLLNNKRALKHVQENFDLQKIILKWEEIYESK